MTAAISTIQRYSLNMNLIRTHLVVHSTYFILFVLIISIIYTQVEFIKAHAYRLEPELSTDTETPPDGIFSLDGEVIEYGPVQAAVLPTAANVMSTSRGR